MDDIKQFEPLWDSWYVAECIGEGSFGKVYRIERKEFNNKYVAALKHIKVPQSQSEINSIMADGMTEKDVEAYFENFVEDIVGEFVLMSKLKGNSHVVSYEDHKVIKAEDKIEWDIFIRMELLTSLIDYIRKNPISKRTVIKLGIDICKALELCQKHNIIHRDIKPENIFVSENGDFKLGDFGIARQIEKTVAGLSKKGTFTYIAPEVYKGEAYGSTVDIYSLGIVMYRLLNNNRVPFMPPYPQVINHADREIALIKRISGQAIEKPVNADGRLAEIVLKACAYDPKDRYNSPLLMRMELESILYNESEAKVIYPKGDKAEIHSVNYVKTDEESTDTLKNTGLEAENADTQLMTHAKDSDKNLYEIKSVYQQEKKEAIDEIESERIEEDHKDKRKVLKIVAIVLVVVIIAALSFKGCSYYNDKKEQEQIAAETAEKNAKAEEAFKAVENDSQYYPYCLYDIDKDGVNELIIGCDGKSEAAVAIYRFNGDAAEEIGVIETYKDVFANKYLFDCSEGIGFIKKTDIGTEYGCWKITNGNIEYNLLASLTSKDGITTYKVEGTECSKDEYESYTQSIAGVKIENYTSPRLTTTTSTTEAITQPTTQASVSNTNNSTGKETSDKSKTNTTKKNATNNANKGSGTAATNNKKTTDKTETKQNTSAPVQSEPAAPQNETPPQDTPVQPAPVQEDQSPGGGDAPPIVVGFD